MPNDTLAANAASMPTRRTAIGSIAAAGALLAAPVASAPASHPDAEVFALARKAKALYADLRAAENNFAEAEQRVEELAIPEALIVTASDKQRFPRIRAAVGEPFSPGDVKAICTTRDVMLEMCALIKWDDLGPNPDGPYMVARAVEVEQAQQKYLAEKEAAHSAAGLPELEEEANRLDDELSDLWRTIAFTPTQTVEGVLAKLDAAAAPLTAGRLNPEEKATGRAPEDVAWMAAVDLGEMSAEREA